MLIMLFVVTDSTVRKSLNITTFVWVLCTGQRQCDFRFDLFFSFSVSSASYFL